MSRIDAQLVERLHRQAGAPQWNVSLDAFAAALERSAGKRFSGSAPTSRDLESYAKGGVQFVGEDRINHALKNETLNLKIGNAFDVVCERHPIDFEKISSNVYELEYEITVRNDKAMPIAVEVNEPPGGTWRMLRSSHEWTQTAA